MSQINTDLFELPQGLVSFPGVTRWRNATMTFNQGIFPAVCTIEVAAVDNWTPPREVGDLSFTYAGERVTLKDCRVASAQFSEGTGGSTIILQILDRRRKWIYGEISGRYNVRKADGRSLEPATRKTPRELAQLCCDAMQEADPDLAAIPNESNPEINWDVDNPAQALMQLCDDLGCRVILGLDNKLRVVKTGQGRELPSNVPHLVGGGDGLAPVEIPDGIVIVGGPTRHQCLLGLEAVGLDTDGEVKGIDGLSYRPPGGWDNQNPDGFGNVSGQPVRTRDGSSVRPRDLAVQTVFRWFRLKEDQQIPGLQGTVKRERIRLRGSLNDTYKDADGVERERPAYAVGEVWYRSAATADFKNLQRGLQINVGTSVDTQRQLVMFSEPVARFQNGEFLQPQNVKLMASLEILDDVTGQPLRFRRQKALGSGTGPRTSGQFLRILRHDEIVLKRTSDTNGRFFFDNTNNVVQEADYYLNAALAEYIPVDSRDRIYPGIVPIEPDGLIVQTTWSVGLQGCTTRASRVTEHDNVVPSYREQSQLAQLTEPARNLRRNILDKVKALFRGEAV